jgi:hypothetical protein
VRYVVRRRVLRIEDSGAVPMEGAEVDSLVEEVVEWIGRNLKAGYPWLGNFRELEQCVRNLMIRNHYHPPGAGEPEGAGDAVEAFLREVRGGDLSSEALLGKYYALVLLRGGSYAAASKTLGVDYRTVQKRIDPGFLSTEIGPARNARGLLRGPDGNASRPESDRR